MEINVDLLRQIRDTANWFIELPTRLVSAYLGTKEGFLNRRERVKRAKEIAELREIAKIIQSLYHSKGDLLAWADRMQIDNDIESAQDVREIFSNVVLKLDVIREAMNETPLSNLQLGAEVSFQLGKAKAAYNALAEISDRVIIEDRGIIEILSYVEKMQNAGYQLLKEVDAHRRLIDNTYD